MNVEYADEKHQHTEDRIFNIVFLLKSISSPLYIGHLRLTMSTTVAQSGQTAEAPATMKALGTRVNGMRLSKQ